MVNEHLSYNSCSHVSELFSAMSLDSEIGQKSSMGKTKSRCLIIYGLASSFKKRTFEENQLFLILFCMI